MRIWRLVVAVMAMVFLSTGMAPAADAAPTAGAGNFCNYSMSTHRQACFPTEAQLLDYRTALGDIPLVAFYNWINFTKAGGYYVYSGNHNCSATTGDYDYVEDSITYWTYTNTGGTMDATISSVSTYTSNASHCDVSFFPGEWLSGVPSAYISSCKDLRYCTRGNWYDRAKGFVLS